MEKEVSEVDRKLFLRKTYLDKIYYHINRNPINQDELYSLIRKFFGEYLKLDYEFTYEELSQELNKVFVTPKVKEHIDDFLIRLSESEYLEETILGTNEINKYLEEFGDIIKNIIYDDQPVHGEESIVQKVLKRHKEAPKIMDVTGINALIEETNFHITNGNMDIAKSSYINLLKAYDALSKDDKKKLHDNLNEVYERLQTLIKNPASQVESGKKNNASYTISDSIKKVRDLADDTLFYINASNAESAKKKYAEALSLYEALDPEDKKLMHSRINDLYNQLQAMLSVTTYIDSEPVSANGSNKDLREEQSGSNNADTSNVALNLDLSTISSSPSIYASPEGFKTDVSIQSGNTLLGNDNTNSNKDLIDIDLSAVSNAAGTQDMANSAAEDNRLFRPDAISENSSGSVQDIFSSNYEKDSNRLSSKESDYTANNDLSIKENSAASNILFTPTVSVESQKSFTTTQNVVKESSATESSATSKTGPMVKKSTSSNIASMPGTSMQTFPARVTSTPTPLIGSESRKPLQVGSLPISSSIPQTKISPAKPASPLASPPTLQLEPHKDIHEKKNIQEKTTSGKLVAPDLKKIKSPYINTSSIVPIPLISEKPIQPSQPAVQSSKPIIFSSSIQPTIQSSQSEIQSTIQPAVDKLNRILKKIDDDIILDKFDKAKSTYKEALLFYRSMLDVNKAKCYEHFYATFKRLDDALHQKSLHDILDKHLLDADESRRPISLASDESSDKNYSSSESSKILKMTTLPVMLANNPNMTRVYELIEESYFNIDNEHSDLAMLKYFKALELYHQLPILDKKKLYSDLYELFKKLSISKKV